MMQYRQLGKTGLEVSHISLGVGSLGGLYGSCQLEKNNYPLYKNKSQNSADYGHPFTNVARTRHDTGCRDER